MENDRDLFLRIRLGMQPRPGTRARDHRAHTFRDGQVLHLPIFLHMLGGDRHPVYDPVEFRHRDGDGNFHRIHPLGRGTPLCLGRDQRIRLQDRHAQILQRLNRNRPRCREGEFHHIHDRIDDGLPVLSKIPVKHFTDRRHPQLRIWQPICENSDHVQPLPLCFFVEGLLIVQVIPDPLIPIKEQSHRRTPLAQERFLIAGEIRHEVFLHAGVVDPRPADR